MRRLHLFEFHDLEWYPNAWRNRLTEVLAIFAIKLKPYGTIVPRLETALKTLGRWRVIDLCSGAAGPALSVLDELDEVDGHPIEITAYSGLNDERRPAAKTASPMRLAYLPSQALRLMRSSLS